MATTETLALRLVLNYTEMNEVSFIFSNLVRELHKTNQADQTFAIETATNAIRTQEKSEITLYHKDIAEVVKKEFDSVKGYAVNLHHKLIIT